ncbi:MAG: cytidylate kinase-like family protein [Clostridia bacterium]|nr:cytidylate kinase-like family protein [Clostridia bacterium]
MKIITISREFGSGGRELGKRLADILGFAYYDREILTAIAEKRHLDATYVEKKLDAQAWQAFPISYRRTFTALPSFSASADLLAEQKRVLEEIAQKGDDCVIVGRNADVLLKAYQPFNIFVCADKNTKLRRCQERADANETLTEKELEKRMKSVDKSRAKTREMLSGGAWGQREEYHLVVNTSSWEIKALSEALAPFIQQWFGREK